MSIKLINHRGRMMSQRNIDLLARVLADDETVFDDIPNFKEEARRLMGSADALVDECALFGVAGDILVLGDQIA